MKPFQQFCFSLIFVASLLSVAWLDSCSEPEPTPTPTLIPSPTALPSPIATAPVIISPLSPVPPPEPASAAAEPEIPYYLMQPSATADDSSSMPVDSLLVAVQRLGLRGDPSQYIEASGIGISFVCKHRQYFYEDNTMDFQNCIIHIDDAQRFYDVFDVKIYMPIVER